MSSNNVLCVSGKTFSKNTMNWTRHLKAFPKTCVKKTTKNDIKQFFSKSSYSNSNKSRPSKFIYTDIIIIYLCLSRLR